MDDSLATARAGFVVACGLFALAWPRAEPEPAPCPRPVLLGRAEIVCVPASAGTPRLSGPARRLFGRPIDPNRADRLTLETLPGIGPARADAILAERAERPFDGLRDLERVRGLGPARVAVLAPFLGFEGPLAAAKESSVKSPGCRSCCGSSRGEGPTAPPSCEEER
jgi:competence protein ComEA